MTVEPTSGARDTDGRLPLPGDPPGTVTEGIAKLTPRGREIIGTAARLFANAGYHNTGMDDIAHACGLKKPTLYHYFTSKGELVYLIHEVVREEIEGRLEQRLRRGEGPRECLLGVMSDIMLVMDTHEGYLQVFFEHHPELSPERLAETKRKRDRFFNSVHRLVMEILIEAGHDAKRVVTEGRLATLALFGMCNWSYQWYDRGGHLASGDIAAYFYDIWLNGVLRAEGIDSER